MPFRICHLTALAAAVFTGSVGLATRTVGAQSDQTICVARARTEMGPDADLSAPLRDALVDGLRAVSANAVALDAGTEGAMSEGAQKNCAFLVLTRVQSHGSGGGLMQRYLRSKGASTTPWTSQPGETGSQLGTMPLASAEQTAIKRGESVTLEYQLTPGRALTPITSGKLEAKAAADGADVLSPLVAQLSSAVAGAARSGNERPTAQPTPSGNKSSDGKRAGSNASGSQAGPPTNINCEQMAAQTRGTISVESCKQMLGAQQSLAAAANDASASRPGDDNLTCDQIAVEMKQQQFAGPDKGKVAEAQAATAEFQKKGAEQQKEGAALVAKESGEQSVLSRLAPTNAAQAAAAEKMVAEQKAMNERMAKEMAPVADRATSANAAVISGLANQMAANPRLARLAQLATAKACKAQ